MSGPQRRVCNVPECLCSCLLWGFLACALAYGLLLIAEGLIGAVQDR